MARDLLLAVSRIRKFTFSVININLLTVRKWLFHVCIAHSDNSGYLPLYFNFVRCCLFTGTFNSWFKQSIPPERSKRSVARCKEVIGIMEHACAFECQKCTNVQIKIICRLFSGCFTKKGADWKRRHCAVDR